MVLVCEPEVVTVVVLDALSEVDETGLRESTSSVSKCERRDSRRAHRRSRRRRSGRGRPSFSY